MNTPNPDLSSVDPEISGLIVQEAKRQEDTLMLIPSENYTSQAVRQALSSVLTNKYSEGYPGKRYYQGNRYIDQIELLAIDRAKKLFGTPHANVQPYSGSPANAAIFFALLNPGDTIMGLPLAAGGHLTHGHPKITFSGKYFRSVPFPLTQDGLIDYEELVEVVKKEQPKLLIAGVTAYPRNMDWKKIRLAADACGAWFVADISHISGLVIGGVHESPAPYAHVIMTTTHKTLRGPRGALIMATHVGVAKDPELGLKLDKAVFPGIQGGPHNHTTAAIAVALKEAMEPSFIQYVKQIVTNARALSQSLINQNITLTTGGTDNHLMLIDLRPDRLLGNMAAEALELAGIVVNRNTIPFDPSTPFYPSGIRLGTPAVTTRGMGGPEMEEIASYIVQVLGIAAKYPVSPDKTQWAKDIEARVAQMKNDKELLAIGQKVLGLTRKFPIG
jgi:glycine hydroxymethyltransferase